MLGDLPAPTEVRAVAVQGQALWVTWDPSEDRLEPLEYLVEGAEECGSAKAATLRWVRSPAGTRSTRLTGDFRPRVPYQVRVYGLYPQGFGASAPVRAYTQEGVPSAGPQGLQDRSISKEASVISWEAIPLAQRNGHLAHYTLYLAAPTGSPRASRPSKCQPWGCWSWGWGLSERRESLPLPAAVVRLLPSGEAGAGEGRSQVLGAEKGR
nr:interleukin-27 receptor subunit alpha [Pelodiscus sinensis]|eukprot:XP_025035844.1 interleukin-27 receptor subunit alpha [Pelodiscus sinensis]